MTQTKSISQECKYFKSCPFDWDCLQEIKEVGSALWSVELCYDLKALIDSGLVEEIPTLEEKKIAIGMRRMFEGCVDGKGDNMK